MKTGRRQTRRLIWFTAIALLGWWAPPLSAQLQSGNLYGTVTDTQGEALPGVTVTLSGPGAQQVQITNAQGQFRFLGLAPGKYALRNALEGFSTVDYPNVDIRIGRNTTVEVTLAPGIEEVITVTSESPLLDERKIVHGATVTQVELEKIPTARDPWAILNQAPGVLTDRINVGGNESGKPTSILAGGSSQAQNTFLVDGVVITDMAALGSSPSYFDFESFEEMQVTTGGSDVSLATGGVTLNLVTKRGTNEWRGSGRYLVTDQSWSSDNTPTGPIDTTAYRNREINNVGDYGASLGGPIVKDRLWIWGGYSQTELDTEVFGGGEVFPDSTTLDNYAARLNAQIADSNRANFFFGHSEKTMTGAGAGPERPRVTTWNQTGPTEIYKLEDTHIFSSNFYLTGMASFVDGGFQLVPQGGLDAPTSVLDSNQIWRRNFFGETSDRTSQEWKVDGSYFFNTGATSHELKFGTSFRQFETTDTRFWPGNQLFVDDPFSGFFISTADTTSRASADYTSFWVQDTLSAGNFTINAGLRYDRQETSVGESRIEPNPQVPNLLPGLTFPGGDTGFEWETITPRIGLTYALGEERKTLLRASYARFAQQLGTGVASLVNPVDEFFFDFLGAPARRGIDKNGNQTLDPGEPAGQPVFFGGIPVDDPRFLTPRNLIDPNYEPTIFNELCLFVERAILPEFVIGGSFSLGNATGLSEFPALVFDPSGASRPVTFGDYRPGAGVTGTLPDGTAYSVPTFTLAPGLTPTGGNLLTNGDREGDYRGVGLTFNKRLSNRWMLNGHVTYQDWTWNVPDNFDLGDPNPFLAEGQDGEVFAEQSAQPDKPGVFLHNTWSFNVNGMYQVAPDRPWGFNVAGNIFGREGYPLPYFRQTQEADRQNRRIQVGEVDDFRTDDILTVDLRLEKEFVATNDVSFTVSADGFNLLNEDYVLQRERRLNRSNTDFVQETLSPRIWRLGVRLNWR